MSRVFYRQGWHLLSLIILIFGAGYTASLPGIHSGSLLGLPTSFWFWLAILIPILHQIIVPAGWRMELYHGWMTKQFGDRAFTVFKAIFLPLFFLRIITLTIVGISNGPSLSLSLPTRLTLGILLTIPALYLGYSVVKYFTIERALGADHFWPEKYRALPMVKEGIFRFTNNGMYIYGFLLLWAVAILLASKAALIVAAFNHIYIWVHYYTVEKPDMDYIYGTGS